MPQAYFPPLDKCLSGEERLISWRTVHQTLSDPARAVDETALETFLNDEDSIACLSNSLEPLPPPTPKSKTDFETKTAPINVSQSTSEYNLEELKKDAQWLSDKLKIEELVALRVVVLEWQSRAEDTLRKAAAASESATLPATNGTFGSSLALRNGPGVPATQPSAEQTRRDRQLGIFLEERSYTLQTLAGLMEHHAFVSSGPRLKQTWLDRSRAKITTAQYSSTDTNGREAYCTRCIDAVGALIEHFDYASSWPEPFQSVEAHADHSSGDLYATAITHDILSTIRILLVNVYELPSKPSSAVLSSWYKLMSRVSFFQALSPAFPVAGILQSLISIISFAVLRVPDTVLYLRDLIETSSDTVQYPRLPNESYLRDEACVKEVNLVLYQAAEQNILVAAPAIFAWSIITNYICEGASKEKQHGESLQIDDIPHESDPRGRRLSRRESTEDAGFFGKLKSFLEAVEFEPEAKDNIGAFFARIAVDNMGVYSIISQLCTTVVQMYDSPWDKMVSLATRHALIELLRDGMALVAYGVPVMESLLTILRPDVPGRLTCRDSAFAFSVASDLDDLVPTIIEPALIRYPYELTPLLRLFIALSSVPDPRAPETEHLHGVVQMLDEMPGMAVMVPENFLAYALDNEDENASRMKLTEALPLFLSRSTLSLYSAASVNRKARALQLQGPDQKNLLSIPASTTGVFLKENKPFVFSLDHSHSGMGYLGLLLSTFLPNSDVLLPPIFEALDHGAAAEIISLITGLLTVTTTENGTTEETHFVLDRFSLGLTDERDIIAIVADTMEVELLAHLEQNIQEGSLDLLVACADFFDKLIATAPERVWSILAGSSLLGLNGGATTLAAVVGGLEVSNGRFRFLTACVSMYSHLITDAILGLVKRKGRPAKPSNRFDSPISFADATPERTMATVLSAYQTVMLDVWQSLPQWRFKLPVELSTMTSLVVKSFSKLLRSAYGVGSGSNGIASLLIPAADRLMDACAPAIANRATIQPFELVLKASLSVADQQIPSFERSALKEQAMSTLEFLNVLIRTANTVDDSGSRASGFASHLLSLMPILASLLVTDPGFKAPLYAVLNEALQAASGGASEPPSLLGQLDPSMAKPFLSVISHLDHPLCEIEVEATIWNMLSAVMSSKQQGFALFLLTGNLPKDKIKDTKCKDTPVRTKSLLAYALEQLSHIATLAPERAIAMLKFVSSAQNTWVWATHEVRSHPEFFKNALDWLDGLQLPTRAANIAEELLSANEHEMAAYLCNILAANLHASNEVGDRTLIKMLPSKLTFLSENGVTVNSYNRSLHRNLKDNFANRFSSCDVSDFKRTAANPAPLGRKYYYDLDFASEVLGHQTAWHGSSNGRSQGFADEFARANVNLSLVEAQMRLVKSWQVLATTLSECVGQDEALQGELAKVTIECLIANAEADLDQPGMDQIMSIRSEMAFIILSQLVNVKSFVPAMKRILPAAWALVRSSPMDYDVATSLEDVRYYRKLLQVLYLAIQPYVYMAPKKREPKATEETTPTFIDPAIATCVVEMMMKLIAPGFRALCGNLHNSTRFAEPGDFALITALLQAALSIPHVGAVHHQLAEIVSNTGIVRGALSLYSWSDQLAESMQQDPIYGEVAIMFLLGLSSIPLVAEHMALSGVLIQLSSANLSNYFRKTGGKSPFSEPRRIFTIWAEGFLPLCLNLLDAVGPPIAAEVAAFLNSFPEQLQRASTALENREPTRQNPYARAITLSLVSEAQSLCLISRILASDTTRGAAEGIDAGDVPDLQYDAQKVSDDAAGLMRQETNLKSRIVPLGEREEVWMADGAGVQGGSVLFKKVKGEINGLLQCMGKDGT